mgnify:CR=1 FL=1
MGHDAEAANDEASAPAECGDHADHARAGDKKIEFARHRPLDEMRDHLGEGRKRLHALFGSRALAVLVPPWNRIADVVVDTLPALGFTARTLLVGLLFLLALPFARRA